MDLPFFQKAVEFQMKYGRGLTVGNGLQTNGILIDREWAVLLRRYKFLVGLSLDGPEYIHNRCRFLRGGQGSWSKVIDKAKLLLDSGVAVTALTVVNDYSVQFPEEIYAFHKDLGLTYMQFIPCLEPDQSNLGKKASFCPSPEAYGEFLIKTFDLWLEDFDGCRPTTSVRFFDSVFYTYVGLVIHQFNDLSNFLLRISRNPAIIMDHSLYSAYRYTSSLGNFFQCNNSDFSFNDF